MPKIPALGVGQKISTDVQMAKQNPQAAGLVWGAIGDVAGGAANVAQEFMEKSAHAEAIDYSLTNSVQYQKDLREVEGRLKTQYAENPDGYGKAFEEESVKIRDNYAANAPSTRARQDFLRNTDAVMLGKVASSYALEQTNKVARFNSNLEKMAVEQGNMQFSNPDAVGGALQFEKQRASIAEQVGAGLIGTAQAVRLEEDYMKMLKSGFKSGLASKDYAGVADVNADPATREKQIDAYLSGDPNKPSLINSMSPEEKFRFKEDAMRTYARIDVQRANETKAAVQKAINSILVGDVDPETPQGMSVMQEQYRSVASNNTLDPEVKAGMIAELNKAVTDKALKTRLALGGDVEGVLARTGDVMANLGGEELARAATQSLGARALEIKSELDVEFAKQPADYLTKYDPGLKALSGGLVGNNPEQYFDTFKARADAMYNQRGTPEAQRKYLPTDVAKVFKSRFDMAMSAQDYTAADSIFTQVQNMGGDKAYGLMKEIGLPEKYMAVGEVSDPAARSRLLMYSNPEVVKKVNDEFATKGLKPVDVEGYLKDDYFTAIKTQNLMSDQSTMNAIAIKQSVESLFKGNVVNGMDPDEAAAAAWGVFKKDNTVLETNSGGSVVLPTKSFSPTAISKAEGLFRMMDRLDPAVIQRELNLSPDVRAEDVAANGVWSYNKATGKIHLLAQRGDAISGGIKTYAVTDANGAPIAFSSKDLESKPWVAHTAAVGWEGRKERVRDYIQSRYGKGAK